MGLFFYSAARHWPPSPPSPPLAHRPVARPPRFIQHTRPRTLFYFTGSARHSRANHAPYMSTHPRLAIKRSGVSIRMFVNVEPASPGLSVEDTPRTPVHASHAKRKLHKNIEMSSFIFIWNASLILIKLFYLLFYQKCKCQLIDYRKETEIFCWYVVRYFLLFLFNLKYFSN